MSSTAALATTSARDKQANDGKSVFKCICGFKAPPLHKTVTASRKSAALPRLVHPIMYT
ncbi:hypothetical protein HMPREF9349_01049 [Escherichia coli MS 79-10]|nr:hypothetical protein HMPREF9349_01049 [Escherichia coli MS 79-10]